MKRTVPRIDRTTITAILAALLLAVVALLFFFPDDIQGRVLQQHDMQQGIANGEEGRAFHEATGESTRWTNALFGGMPNFQIAPSYPANDMLSWVVKVYTLWLPSPANILFAMMLGFFLMCLCFRMKWYTSLFAALAWGFSTYFIIIIGAGHIWKFMTLAFIPPTIGGLALLYRGRYLGGVAMTGLFGALQLQSNHPQMTYYFLFVIAAFVIGWAWLAWKEKKLTQWLTASVLALFAGCLALAANSASLYNSYEYSKETIRGRATDLSVDGQAPQDGLDFDYITGWSYGPDETLTLLIPNVRGGASVKPVGGQNTFLSLGELDKAQKELDYYQLDMVRGFPQYFGNQPMTNGPVYVGAFVLVLAILALFVVEGPMIWCLFAVTILAILLSWGHNLAGFSRFFIDNFPGYNKFRTVSSILVIVEFTLPLMAAMCVRKMITTPAFFNKYRYQLLGTAGFFAAVCFIGWISPSVLGPSFSISEVEQLKEAGYWDNPDFMPYLATVRELRQSMVSADCLRSLIFILLGTGIVWAFFKLGNPEKRRPALFVCALAALVLVDLFSVNKRYVNSENFTAPESDEVTFNKTAADEAILADKGNYRVWDITDMDGARSSYFHKTVGGYHAAKLTRYNDLFTNLIKPTNSHLIQALRLGLDPDSVTAGLGVMNMLNARYLLAGDQYIVNPNALGNAWFVSKMEYVDDADEEMDAVATLNPAVTAVADKKFKDILGNAMAPAPGDTIYETGYAPNRLTYRYKSAKGGVAVFSEVFFPWGWNATVDGKEVPIGRVDYTLRAMKLPAGEHEIVMTFDPKGVKVTNTVSVIAVILIWLSCLAAIGAVVWKQRRHNANRQEEPREA